MDADFTLFHFKVSIQGKTDEPDFLIKRLISQQSGDLTVCHRLPVIFNLDMIRLRKQIEDLYDRGIIKFKRHFLYLFNQVLL